MTAPKVRSSAPSLVRSLFRRASGVQLALVCLAGALELGCASGDPDQVAQELDEPAREETRPLSVSDLSVPLAIELPDEPDPMLSGLVPPATAPTRGMWSPVHSWPLNGLHSTLLPNGRVVTYGTPSGQPANQDGRTMDIWNPTLGFSTASHTTTYEAQRVNSFCSSAAFLGDGSLFISGGNSPRESSLLSPTTGVVTKSPFRMASDRWYGSLITLADGRFIMLGGSGPYAALRAFEDPASAINAGQVSMVPEVYEPGTGFRSLFGATSRDAFGPDYHRYWYPRAWVAPNGEVFGISSEKMWYLNPQGNGSIRVAGNFKTPASATTRPNIGPTSAAAMFAPGRILQVGGNGYYDGHNLPGSPYATVIDINSGSPVVSETSPMAHGRQWPSLTVLPDGRVVVTGGTRYGNNGGSDAVYAAEIWDPETGTWTLGASAAVVRVYHSAAILLPNGTVLSTGGGAPGPVNNLNAEVYYPPYLFRATQNGGAELAPRPRAVAVSSLAPKYGETLELELAASQTISRVVLVGASSVTHSFNTSQRRIELPFIQVGSRIGARIPEDRNVAPPGYYLVFALDAQGVPSKGVIVAVGESLPAPPVQTVLPKGSDLTLMSVNVAHSAWATNAQSLGILKNLGENPSEADLLTAKFIARDGLADSSCVSFESVAQPGRWLRHYSYRLRIDPNDGSALFKSDATFCVEPGLTGTGFTFRSKNFPDRVIRHRNYELWIDPVTSGGTFAADATFTLRKAPLPTIPAIEAPIVAVGATASYAPALSVPGARYIWDFGDGAGAEAERTTPSATHVYSSPGIYLVTLTVRMSDGRQVSRSFAQAVRAEPLAGLARSSSQLALTTSPARVWVVHPDHDSVGVIDATNGTRIAEIAVGKAPRSVAVAPNGRIWVTSRDAAQISMIHPSSLSVEQTISLKEGSRPYGLVFAPETGLAYVSLEGTGEVLELNGATGAVLTTRDAGPLPRGIGITSDGGRLFVSRFMSPPVPGEATVSPLTAAGRAEVRAFDVPGLSGSRTLTLAHSDVADTSVSGRGLPNYLGAPVVSPDGASLWVPSKQDNIARGLARDGQNLDFQNTVRAIVSRIDLQTETEELGDRVDVDNAGLVSAVAFHPSGAYLFSALETSREVAVLNPVLGSELFRVRVGRAPQSLTVSEDGTRLFVQNFMDRSLSIFDLSPLVRYGTFTMTPVTTVTTATNEPLSAELLLGKQLFYDAFDTRLARDGYMSCASCHAEGEQDGRVWDLTGQGEGLRNTISLVGSGSAARLLHWSGNFDEVQDFEAQIRGLAGGTGLLSDAVFLSGSVSEPLGSPKAGLSGELDALAAYVNSLKATPPSPERGASLTAAGLRGRDLFVEVGCTSCHYGSTFANESSLEPKDIGTLKESSGQRLYGPLLGIDVPPLRGVWRTAPYLHDGSASTIEEAISAHSGLNLEPEELSDLAAYVRQIDAREEGFPKRGCGDGIKNDSETDVDCGGACPPCVDGAECREALDCGSGLCVDGLCVPQPSCEDGVHNGSETDVDCGGGCPSCDGGRDCQFAADCLSALCESGVCAAVPTCEDDTLNQDETDIDCGGVCPGCPNGSSCDGHSDCASGVCSGYVCVAAPTCTDGIRNQNETDVDCGGVCPACPNGGSCGGPSDCASGVCVGGVCVAAPTCTDGIRNQNETDVDCGGVCGKCSLNKMCGGGNDCQSGVCTGGRCGAAPASKVTAQLSYQSTWGGGYCVDLTIRNTSSTTVSSWTVVLNLNQSTMNNGWSANYVGNGAQKTVTPMSWNSVLGPNASTVVGFCATTNGSNWQPVVVSAQ